MNSKTRIAALIIKLAQDELSEQEKGQLQQWLDTSETNRFYFGEITNSARMLTDLHEYRLAEAEKLSGWQKILNKGLPKPMAKERRFGTPFWLKVSAVAAILITALAGAWLLFVHNPQIEKEKPISIVIVNAKDIAPGMDGAILTLSNGSQIILDSTTNGNLAMEGNMKIAKKDGRLIYTEQKENETSNEILYNTISTAKGRTFRLRLGDGSEIILDADSKVILPASFAKNERKIEVVSGQVFFSVKHNEQWPFKVVAYGTEIYDLGTDFNVDAYKYPIKTTLVEGRIRVQTVGNKKMAVLRPGQQSESTNDELKVISNADIDMITSWKEGSFYFNNTELKEVMQQLSRWYNVEVEYKGDKGNLYFGGIIRRNTNLSEVLKMLKKTDVNFSIEGRKIIVQ